MNRLAVTATAALLLALPSGAASATAGTISGTVQSLTGGRSGAVTGQEVTLKIYINAAEVGSQTTRTDAAGRFAFTVPADPARTYVVNVKYKGGDYTGPPVTLKDGETAKPVVLRVYEPTTDPGVLQVNIHHMIVEPGEGLVQVTELLVFANRTDRTYVGARERPDGKRETLAFRLPEGAGNISYMEGLRECCVFSTRDGFVDTTDVKPGMRQIGFSYTIPFSGGRAILTRTLDYPTDAVEVFGSPAARLTAVPLAAQAPVATEQGSYSRYSGQSIPRGTALTLTLTGLPGAPTSGRRLLLAAFAGVMAAALVYPFIRKRRSTERTPRTREDLVRAVAALDDLYEAGGIGDAEYRRRRAQHKARLVTLTAPKTESPAGAAGRDNAATLEAKEDR